MHKAYVHKSANFVPFFRRTPGYCEQFLTHSPTFVYTISILSSDIMHNSSLPFNQIFMESFRHLGHFANIYSLNSIHSIYFCPHSFYTLFSRKFSLHSQLQTSPQILVYHKNYYLNKTSGKVER